MTKTKPTQAVEDWLRTQSEILLVKETDRVVRLVRDAISEEVPEFTSDPSLVSTLDASTAGALRLLPVTLWGEVSTITAPEEMTELGRTLALRRLDLGLLLRAYRVGQRVVWHDLMSRVARSDLAQDLRAEALEYLWDRVSRMLETMVEQVVDAYVEERQKVLTGTLARRRESVEALLAGESREPGELTSALGHRFAVHQTGLVLWTRADEGDAPFDVLERAARDLARSLGGPPPLTLPAGSRRLWAWVATPTEPDVDGLALSERHAASGIRVAVGAPAPGIDGFRRTHQTALRAEVVMALGSDVPLTRFHDVELLTLLARDLAGLEALVERELGGLASTDLQAVRLRETVYVYLEAGSSSRAAERLGVHKNTILYRIQQAEQLLERPVDALGLPARVALAAVADLGWPLPGTRDQTSTPP